MDIKFRVGDVVYVNKVGVGRITDVIFCHDPLLRDIIYKYDVIFIDGVEKRCAEDELELYIENACETPNNVVHNSATRPCYYLEEKAMFHRWVDETKLIMKFDAAMTSDKMWALKHDFEEIGMVPASVNVVPVTNTFALIEVADGSMKKVPPEEIRFVTDKELFCKERKER